MRNRILKVLIGLLAVAVAMAVLLGVLEQLSLTKPTDISKNTASPSGTAGSFVLGGGNSTGIIPNVPNLNLLKDSPNGLSLNISPQGGLPSHIPLFDVSGAAGISYLRSVANSVFDYNTWKMDSSASFSPYLGEKLTPDVKYFSKSTQSDIKVTLREKFQSGPIILPTSMYPTSVSSSLPLNYYSDEEAFISPQGMPDSYSFQSINYAFDPAILNKASVDPDNRYLRLPSTTPGRIKQLAQEITQGASSPYQKAKAIESYLKKNYVYDYSYRPAPAGNDPNDWFLFDEKKGVCSNFNSAFVVLARSSGIPSRMVSGYAISPTSDKQTVYADQAHAWAEVKFNDLGWITFDATGTSPPPLATKTDITSVSPLIRKGHSLSVQGTVRTLTGEPVDGVPVELFINSTKTMTGGTKIGEGMVSNGTYSVESTISDRINVGNYQLLAHSLGGIRYGHSWSDPAIKITTETQIKLNIPEKVKISEPVPLQGNLLEESNVAISGQKIDLSIDNRPVHHLVTDKEGQFNFDQIFTQPGEVLIKANYNNTDFYLSSSQVSRIQVLVPTVLNLAVPPRARVSDPDVIQGTLLETQSKKPVSGKPIQILLNGKTSASVMTNSDGKFKVSNAFDKSGIFQIEAKFSSVPYFWEAQDKAVIEISSLTNTNQIYVIIALLLAVLGLCGFIWFRWLRPRPQAAATRGLLTAEVTETDLQFVPIKADSNPKVALKIEFPEIDSFMPDVWGIGDNLKVVCRLINTDEVRMAAKTLNIQIEENKFAIITDDRGTGTFSYTFSKKGLFKFIVKYNCEPEIEEAVADRVIRIVDYREEIIDLYNAMIRRLRGLKIDISPEATAREVKEAVIKAKNGIPAEAISQAVSCFEQADYSIHQVNRNTYKAMYLAQKEIRAHE